MVYYLDKAECPTIPVPHDCVISNISVSDDVLIFNFEQDISRYQHMCPNAKSLTIKMHLIDTFDIYQMRIKKFPKFKSWYAEIDFDRLVGYTKQGLEYLYHYVGYQSLIVKLYCKTHIIVDLYVDYIEYIWEM